MELCCPRCRGALAVQPSCWECRNCESAYPIRFGFVDLRLGPAEDVDYDADLEAAAALAEFESRCAFAPLRERYYAIRPEASAALHDRHEMHFQAESERAPRILRELPGSILDLGCGAGQYLLAASRDGRAAAGIDASLSQLILARRLLADEGFRPLLAAANVEELPFRQNAFHSVIASDILEHVSRPGLLLSEARRVMKSRGRLWLTTPNRWSLTPEPHVGLWGVGWLPRRAALRYVKTRVGVDYGSIRLLSLFGLRRRLRRAYSAGVEIRLPQPTQSERKRLPVFERGLAAAYLVLSKTPLLRGLLLLVVPYFEAVCTVDEDVRGRA